MSALAACGLDEGTSARGEAAASTTAPFGAPSDLPEASDPKVPPQVDPALVAALETIGQKCELDPKRVSIKSCPNDEHGKLRQSFLERDRAAALDSFSAVLSGDDARARIAAAALANALLGDFGEAAEVSKAAARRYLSALRELDEAEASRALRPGVHAAVLAGEREALYSMLDQRADKSMWATALRELAVHGRTDVLPKLEAVAAGNDTRQVAAALSAPRRMRAPTEAEKAAVCPWSAAFIGHEQRRVWEEAGHNAIWCGGEYIDQLLAQGEREVSEGRFDRSSYLVFRDVCFSPNLSRPKRGSDAQCERTYQLLRRVVDDERIDAKLRGLALFGIYYQRRDEASLALMKAYASSKVPELRERAREALASLEKNYVDP